MSGEDRSHGLKVFLKTHPDYAGPGSDPFTEYVIRVENRQRVLGILSASHRKARSSNCFVMRTLTNTVVFSAVKFIGRAGSWTRRSRFAALLLEGEHLTAGNEFNAVFEAGLHR